MKFYFSFTVNCHVHNEALVIAIDKRGYPSVSVNYCVIH